MARYQAISTGTSKQAKMDEFMTKLSERKQSA
jgi:hypothetical protein